MSYKFKIPVCSNNILIPNKIFPILTPTKENKNVVTPITATDFHISTDKKANDTPIAKASMLVAIAIISMVLNPVQAQEHSPVDCSLSVDSSSDIASLIILTPIMSNNPNAIQWSKDVMRCSN